MSNKYALGLAATAAILLSACGGDVVTEVTEVNETGMKVLDKGEKMPKCNADSEGDMIYALDSAGAFICIDKKWTSLNGKDGADGKDGKDGDKGDKGDQGKKGEKGDQGEKGEDGASCTAEALADSSGYKIICGGDSVGVVLNGEKGDKGDQGEQGPKGDSGILKCPSYDASEQFCDFRDGRVYRYVTIGTQTWMAENLNFVTDSSLCYDNDPANCETYGRLYGLKEKENFCPWGWRLPTAEDFDLFFETVGNSNTAAPKLKDSSWGGTDDFGFAALPAGTCKWVGDEMVFSGLGGETNFWTYSYMTNKRFRAYLDVSGAYNFVNVVWVETNTYKSVRCIKDE